MKKVMFFNNGNTVHFDNKGEQVSKLQKSWIELYFNFLESKGIDPLGIEYTLPNGNIAVPFKTDKGYNWEIK